MRYSNKLLYGLFFCCSLYLVCSCEDDEEPVVAPPANTCLKGNEITISNIKNIPANITFNKVKAEISGDCWDIIGTVETTYANGEAILTLPTEFPVEKLAKVARSDASDYTGFWPAVTNNTNAKVAGLGDFIAYNNDEKVGRIYLSDWTGEGPAEFKYFVYYHYTNQPFTLSGYNLTIKPSDTKSYKYEVTFQKGWNVYANIKAKEPETDESSGPSVCTTVIPEGLALEWYFESWGY